MSPKKIKALIAAGVFSTALLAGKAYSGDQANGMPKKAKKEAHKHLKGNSCAGKNGCKGKGGCKSGDHGCAGKNSCKGKGGCATGDFKMKSEAAPAPSSGEKAMDKQACAGKSGCGGH